MLARYQEELAEAINDGDVAGQVQAVLLVADALLKNGDVAGSIRAAEEAAPLYLSLGDRLGHANAVGHMGWLTGATGDHVTACALLNRAVTLFSGLGYQRGHGDALVNMAVADAATGDYEAAGISVRQALDLSRRARDPGGQLGALLLSEQRSMRDRRRCSRASERAEAPDLNSETGDPVMQGYVLIQLANAQRLNGDGPAAAATISRAFQEWGDPAGVTVR